MHKTMELHVIIRIKEESGPKSSFTHSFVVNDYGAIGTGGVSDGSTVKLLDFLNNLKVTKETLNVH